MKRRILKRKVQLGDPVIVRVAAPATSGYYWNFLPDVAAWRLVGQTTMPAQTFGGANETEFRFEPLRLGKITIRGRLERSWENEPLETLDIDITTK